jgi:hypothetical protein
MSSTSGGRAGCLKEDLQFQILVALGVYSTSLEPRGPLKSTRLDQRLPFLRRTPRTPRLGITGSWYAWPPTHIGHELVAAGMLILAGNGRGFPFDYDELERWTRVGYERGMRSRKGER